MSYIFKRILSYRKMFSIEENFIRSVLNVLINSFKRATFAPPRKGNQKLLIIMQFTGPSSIGNTGDCAIEEILVKCRELGGEKNAAC